MFPVYTSILSLLTDTRILQNSVRKADSMGTPMGCKPLIQKLTNSVAPEPEGSSPHSQQPPNGPHHEPGESTPQPPPNQSP
jgi:hypothetical protein